MSQAQPIIDASLALGPVELTVTDLQRSISFYEQVIGLSLLESDEHEASLGVDETPLVHLVEERDAGRPGRESGLYHFALLFPDRKELARVAVRVATAKAPIQGMSDHRTHEAIYLPDPDGNGIELAADRPRDQWPDRVVDPEWLTTGPEPLDLPSLLAEVDGEPPLPRAEPGLRMGHLHIHVGDIDRGLAFYRDVLGFEVQGMLDTAAFVSAGGYHHHLAFNTWRGEEAGPATEDVVGLRHWTIVIGEPSLAELRSRLEAAAIDYEDTDAGILVRDPFRIALLVVPSSRPQG